MPLPPGLILNPQTGELTGLPSQAGTFAIALEVKDALGNRREITDEVNIAAYTLMTWDGSLAHMMATRAISPTALTLTGGLAPYSFVIASGSLPDGLTIDANTGVISGTPTTAGPYAFTVRVTDGIGQTADTLQTGSVVDNLTIDYGATVPGTVGVAFTDSDVTAGGTAPYTYALIAGTLPSGIAFSATSANFTGTPTAPNSGTVTVEVTDAFGFTATDDVTFDIRAYPTISGSFVRGMVGKAYSRTFTGANGYTPYAWQAGDLPAGLSMGSGTGTVSGTPNAPGGLAPWTYNSTVTMTDAQGNVVQRAAQQVQIAAALNLGGTYNTNATRNIPYPTFNPAVAGGWSPYVYDISAGALPNGLTLNTTNGAISGTPIAQGVFTATLRVTDADGSTATLAFNLTVAGDMAITGSVPTLGTTTVAFTGDNLGVTGGTSPYTWSVSAGALPNGITLNTSTGDLTGTPTLAGTYNYTIKVTDAAGGFVTQAFTTTVAAFPTLTGDLPDDTKSTTYSASLSRAGGHSPFAFDISAGALPTGLSINGTTGAITGTSTTAGTYNFTVRVTDNAGNVATKADTIVIYEPVVFTGSYIVLGEVTDPFSSTTQTTTGGKPPIAYSLAGGALPPGLTLNAGTAAITGTPTVAGHYSYTVRATDALGFFVDWSDTLDIFAAVGITGDYTANAEVGVAYSSDLNPTGGAAAYTWAVITGALPTGLSLGSGTGTITGTPTVAGTYNFTVRVTDGFGVIATRADSIVVVAAVDITGDAPNRTVGVSYPTFTPTRTGGLAPFTYSIVSGALPGGLTMNTTTGAITGTPTTAGTFNFTIRVTSALGGTDDLADSIQINAYPTLTLNYSRGTVGKVYSDTVTAGSGWSPYTFSVVAGAIPTGLSLNSSTGAITGTPANSGTYNFTIRLTDSVGNIVDRAGSIAIAAAMSYPGTYATPHNEDTAYSSTVTASGGWTPRSYAVIAGAVPTGTTLGASTGTISGTPPTPGTYNFTIRATDADGSFIDKAFSIVISTTAVALSLTAGPNPSHDTGQSIGGQTITVTTSSTMTATGGSGVYTSYTWSFVSRDLTTGNDLGSPTFTNGGRTCSFSHSGRFEYDAIEVWRARVQDSLGAVATFDVTFHLTIFTDL